MRLQNILYPTEYICNEEALYLHKEEGFVLFDGYFNLFYLEKYHKYCDISELRLELKFRGVKKIMLMHDRDVIHEVNAENETAVSLELPYEEYGKGVFWFKAQPMDMDGDWEIRGHFDGRSNVSRNIKVAVGICTFKREKYVLRNIGSMLNYFEVNRDVMDLFQVFLVDNGRTLSGMDEFGKLQDRAREIGGENLLTLIENRNDGGTGGFTRAMEEAIARKEELGITNLMLLDDDAIFDPEIFLRLGAFLGALWEEYKDITVGGAMWREDMPYYLYAFGEYHEKCKITNPCHMFDLREFDVCSGLAVCRRGDNENLFSGWWCCTYSMQIITKDTLPMPFFIHLDDILFCRLHARGGIAFIPGIGVWHQGFELRFPGVNQYYNTRNELITAAVMDNMKTRHIARWAIRQLSAPLLSLRYGEMELTYRGIMDFLKGPGWLDQVDGEKLHLELINEYRSRAPYAPLSDALDENEYNRFAQIRMGDEIRRQMILGFWSRRRKGATLKQYLSINGWLLPSDKTLGYYCNADSPWSLYRKGKVLLYEPEAGRGYIETRRFGKLIRCCGMVVRSVVLLLLNYRKMEKAYRKRAGTR